MITRPLSFCNPFGHDDLAWCRSNFVPSDLIQLRHSHPIWGPVVVELPSQLSRAVKKRRTEFLVGRLCAAYALRQLGQTEAVGRRDRAPVCACRGRRVNYPHRPMCFHTELITLRVNAQILYTGYTRFSE